MKRIELHAKTQYGIDNESTIDIKNLILKCVENHEKGVALVDTNTNISFLKAEKILKELKIKDFKLIYGTEIMINYNKNDYRVVILLKNKKGYSHLNRLLSNIKGKIIFLDEIIKYRKYFVIGLIYEQNNYDDNLLDYFDYIEVDNNISKKVISNLKTKSLVIYSNKINALSEEELVSKKILYKNLRRNDQAQNKIYQTTEDILNEINDQEIVVDNPHKIFNMIEQFDLIDDEVQLPTNNDFDIELQVYINLNKKFGDCVPHKVKKRVEEELKLIHEFNYDGFINIYQKIVNKCKEENEEYVILDNMNNLYIAYLLEIIHFNPIKLDLNSDLFFSSNPIISIKVAESFEVLLKEYLKNELKLNLIKCKGLINLSDIALEKAIDKYELENNLTFSLEERINISKYLDNYPVNNRGGTYKYLLLPEKYNKYNITSIERINGEDTTKIDYKDLVDKFLTIEIFANSELDYLSELKELTHDYISNNNYKDKKIIKSPEYRNFLKQYENFLILDDLYEELINSNIELPEIFNIINEIRQNKVVSKKTKCILEENNIKLKKYHDIVYISRGVLLEKTRLKYELLYFKEYYQLEYYYMLLKNCLFSEIIEIIAKGYDEMINKINNYDSHRYEYYYLNIAKELYESNINFVVEKRFLGESFTFELDKENNQIILVINKLNEDINKYLNNKLSLIGTRPINGKMLYLSKIIHKLLSKDKCITLFGLDAKETYYVEYLLSHITGLNRKSIHQYLNPCSNGYDEILAIDEKELHKGIRYLLKHTLNIKDYHNINDSIIENANTLLDKIIYMINNSESEIIIIDGLENISKDIDKTLKKLGEISQNKNFIIFTTLKREWEKEKINNINAFNNENAIIKYIDIIQILDGKNIYEVEC